MNHWSTDFYREAKAEGFKFAFRQHIPNFVDGFEGSLHKLKTREEIWELPLVKRWKENEIYEGVSLPTNHPQAVKDFEFMDYTPDGEQLLKANLNNGQSWVIGYFMDLEKFSVLSEKQRNKKRNF